MRQQLRIVKIMGNENRVVFTYPLPAVSTAVATLLTGADCGTELVVDAGVVERRDGYIMFMLTFEYMSRYSMVTIHRYYTPADIAKAAADVCADFANKQPRTLFLGMGRPVYACMRRAVRLLVHCMTAVDKRGCLRPGSDWPPTRWKRGG